MRTADDDIGLIAGDMREGFVKIEIVAGEESEAETFHLEDRGERRLEDVVAVTAILLDLAFDGVLFVIRAGTFAGAVEGNGGIAEMIAEGVVDADKQHGVTARGGRGGLFKQAVAVFLHACAVILLFLRKGGDVGCLGQDDQIEGRVAFL